MAAVRLVLAVGALLGYICTLRDAEQAYPCKGRLWAESIFVAKIILPENASGNEAVKVHNKYKKIGQQIML